MSIANMKDNSNAMVQNHLANHYFWKWTQCTGMGGSTIVKVDVERASVQVLWSSPGHITLEPGDRIRIGLDFETTVLDIDEDDDDLEDTMEDSNPNRKPKYFRIKDPYSGRSQGT
jgi:RNA polymerase-associated protein CTR9